jgi:hypothetical protein
MEWLKFAVLASVRNTRAYRSSRRAPRGGNCGAENDQPCPASVLSITDAEVEVRPPLDAPSHFPPPTRCHACHLETPRHVYPPTTLIPMSCFLLVDPSPSPILNALGKPTRPPSSPASRREVWHASPGGLCRVSMSSVSLFLLPPLLNEPW